MLTVDPDTGQIAEARQVPSPNCDARPADCQPELIVLHGISLPPGQFGGPWIDHLFTNSLDHEADPFFEELRGVCVSAHVLVRRDGDLVQYVPLNARAWHAGESCFAGRARCNDYSVGIELEGSDQLAYAPEQYVSTAELIRSLRSAITSLKHAPVVAHSEIAPGRKTDPGPAFDWQHLHALLNSER